MIDAAPFGDMPDQYYAEYDPAVGHAAGYSYGEEGEYGDPGSVAHTEDWQEGDEGYDEGEYDEEFEEGEEFDA